MQRVGQDAHLRCETRTASTACTRSCAHDYAKQSGLVGSMLKQSIADAHLIKPLTPLPTHGMLVLMQYPTRQGVSPYPHL